MLLVVSLFFTSTQLISQTLEPDSTQIYRGLPIVPFEEPGGNWRQATDQYGITGVVLQRKRTLDFFNTMVTIAEPSTISPVLNYAINIDDYQKKTFLLDADIQVPIAVGGKKWYSKKHRMHTIHFIPQFKVRNFFNDDHAPGSPDGRVAGDESLPVRTPSYMPRITYYRSGPKLWDESRLRDAMPRMSRRFWGFSAFHHSNGQDGPEFYNDSTVNLPNAQFGQINVYNGNFGEQVVFEIIHGGVYDFRVKSKPLRNPTGLPSKVDRRQSFSRTVPSDSVNLDFPFNRRWYWRAALEIHWPDALTNREFDELDLYGRWRLNLQSGFSWIPNYRDLILSEDKSCFVQTTPTEAKESLRIVGNLQYILDFKYNDGDLLSQQKVPYLSLKRLNLYVTAYWRMSGAPNSALFLRAGYWGSDNYNIYFQQRIVSFKFGLALAFFKYPKLADFQRESGSR